MCKGCVRALPTPATPAAPAAAAPIGRVDIRWSGLTAKDEVLNARADLLVLSKSPEKKEKRRGRKKKEEKKERKEDKCKSGECVCKYYTYTFKGRGWAV